MFSAFSIHSAMLEPRYSTMVGGGGSAAGGGSTQRLLEAAAAANAAQHHHEQQQQAAAAVAAAANANRLSLSSEHAAIDLSRKSVAAAAAVSDDVDVEESDDEAPLDLKVRRHLPSMPYLCSSSRRSKWRHVKYRQKMTEISVQKNTTVHRFPAMLSHVYL